MILGNSGPTVASIRASSSSIWTLLELLEEDAWWAETPFLKRSVQHVTPLHESNIMISMRFFECFAITRRRLVESTFPCASEVRRGLARSPTGRRDQFARRKSEGDRTLVLSGAGPADQHER